MMNHPEHTTHRKRRARKGRLTTAVATVALVTAFAAPAQASVYYGGGMPQASFPVSLRTSNLTYNAAMQNSITSWNNSSTKINISMTSNAPNTATAAAYQDGWYGVYAPRGSGNARSFQILLNSYRISSDASNISNFIQSVMVHEVGHALSLNDNPPVSGTTSIMRYDRNRNTMIYPQRYDITNVNNYY